MSAPAFLIFLPVRNGGELVRIAVESILAQSFADWELVILENASTDDTLATLRSFDDPRIRIESSDRPLGIYENWSRGLEYLVRHEIADDVLVTFLGHDDLFYPDFLARIAQLAAAQPDATLYQTAFDLIDEQGRLLRVCRPIPERETWRDLATIICWGMRDVFGTGYVYRAGDYRAIGGIPDLPLLLHSDNLLFIRLTRLGYKACSPTIDFAYRIRRGSTGNNAKPETVAAYADALHRFHEVLHTEFDEFAGGDVGRAAIASLIARSLFPLNAPFVHRALDAESRMRLQALAARYEELARGVPRAHLVGPPMTPSRIINAMRYFNITTNFLRRR